MKTAYALSSFRGDFQGAIKEIELYFSFFLTGRMYLKYRSG